MSCCNNCAIGGECDCSASAPPACVECRPYSRRAEDLMRQDRAPAVALVIPAGTTALITPPARGAAVYNYSCAKYLLKVTPDAVNGATAADAAGIRWVQTIDPSGAAARQEGLESRTGNQFLCGDSCQFFPIDADVVGQPDIEILQLEVANTNLALGMNASLEIQGRALCVPKYQEIPA